MEVISLPDECSTLLQNRRPHPGEKTERNSGEFTSPTRVREQADATGGHRVEGAGDKQALPAHLNAIQRPKTGFRVLPYCKPLL